MAYSTGNFLDMNDLLGILRNFCNANGWVEDVFESAGASDGSRYITHRAGCQYMALQSGRNEPIFDYATYGVADKNGIGICGCTGYDHTLSFCRQPGAMTNFEGNVGYGASLLFSDEAVAGAFHLFANNGGDQIVLFAFAGDQWRQLAFGKTSENIPFFAASCGPRYSASDGYTGINSYFLNQMYADPNYGLWSCHNSCYVDGEWTHAWWGNNIADGSLCPPLGNQVLWVSEGNINLSGTLWITSNGGVANSTNPLLIPTHLTQKISDGHYKYLGYIPDLYVMNTNASYEDGQEIILGSDSYIVSNVDPNGYETSDDRFINHRDFGVVCKKVI